MHTPLLQAEGQNKFSTGKNVTVFLLVGALMWFLGFQMGERHDIRNVEVGIAENGTEPIAVNSSVNTLSEFQSLGIEIAVAENVDEEGIPQWVLDTIALGEHAMRQNGWTDDDFREVEVGLARPGRPKRIKKKKLDFIQRTCKKATGSARTGPKSKCQKLVDKGVKYFGKLIEINENVVCQKSTAGETCGGLFPIACQRTMSQWCSQISEDYHWSYTTYDLKHCRDTWESQNFAIASASVQTIMLFMSGGTLAAVRTFYRGAKSLSKGLKAAKGIQKLKFLYGMVKKAAIQAGKVFKKKLWKHLKTSSKSWFKANKEKVLEVLLLEASEAVAMQEARSEIDLEGLGMDLVEALDPTGIVEMARFLNSFKTCKELNPTVDEKLTDADMDELSGFMKDTCGVPALSGRSPTKDCPCPYDDIECNEALSAEAPRYKKILNYVCNNDPKKRVKAAKTWGECMEACDKDQSCVSFEFSFYEGKCYTSTSCTEEKAMPYSSTTGRWIDHGMNTCKCGGNVETWTGVSVDDCKDNCYNAEWCKSFEYDPVGRKCNGLRGVTVQKGGSCCRGWRLYTFSDCNERSIKEDGSDYRGCISVTKSGRTCQKWTENTPHEHKFFPKSIELAKRGIGKHNYCRNPDNEPNGAWCYTTDPEVRWEYCAVPFSAIALFVKGDCNEKTIEDDGSDYRGCVAQTKNGLTCQKWTVQKPQSHDRTPEKYSGHGLGNHNYCRNPDGEPDGAWCYTTDKNVRWEYCDVGATNGENHR